ncbi:TolC family protein [Larkinella humicola]|uniref:TolC family protein n=1 Tax=Larkinella humicola TaxID=2607654 RepID=A0A5N1JNN5_9BACT|nr:TolC family protein [Larkinella humicola]
MTSRLLNLVFNTHRKGIILPFLCLFIHPLLFGQTTVPTTQTPAGQAVSAPNDTLYLDITQDLSTQLLPFEEIYKLALARSPLIRLENESIITQNADYKLSKIQILESATGFTNYSFGNQAILSNTSFGADALGQIANGYRTGVGLQISLYDLFGRGHKIRQARANYQSAVIKKEIAELQLKKDLVTIYQDLMTSQRVLKIRIQDEQAAFAVYRIAEADSQQGRIDPKSMATASNGYAQTKSIAEQARGEFLKNVFYLEATVGVPIQQLKRK